MFIRCQQETSSPAGRIADDFPDLRIDQFNHHFDNMPGSPELPVLARDVQLREQVFVNVAFGIPVATNPSICSTYCLHSRGRLIQVRFPAAVFFVAIAIECYNELQDITSEVKYISQHIHQSQVGGIPLPYMLYISLLPM
jgi:hypothetical protein